MLKRDRKTMNVCYNGYVRYEPVLKSNFKHSLAPIGRDNATASIHFTVN